MWEVFKIEEKSKILGLLSLVLKSIRIILRDRERFSKLTILQKIKILHTPSTEHATLDSKESKATPTIGNKKFKVHISLYVHLLC